MSRPTNRDRSLRATIETYLASSRFAASTIVTKRYALERFVTWVAANELDIADVGAEEIAAFFSDLRRQGMAHSSRIQHFRSVKTLLDWMVRSGHLTRSPMADMKAEPIEWTPARSASLDDLRLVLDGAQNVRAWSMIALLAFNSLKVSEVVSCNVADVEDLDGVTVLHFRPQAGKNRLPYTVLSPEVAVAARSQLLGRTFGPLFVTPDGTRLSRGGAAGLVRQAARRSGLDYKLTPKHLSSMLATTAIEYGFSYRSVVRAQGIVQPKYARRWLTNLGDPAAEHASVAFARLVLSGVESTESMLGTVERMLTDAEIPQGLAMAAAGAVFENYLRQLCIAHGLAVRPDPKKDSIHRYTALLHEAGKIRTNERHVLERIGNWRNDASHGNFAALQAGAAREMLRSSVRFAGQHPLES